MLLKYREFTGKEQSKVIMTVVMIVVIDCLLIETLVNEGADVYSGVLWLVYSAYFRHR